MYAGFKLVELSLDADRRRRRLIVQVAGDPMAFFLLQ
jgi:hypothetical protein